MAGRNKGKPPAVDSSGERQLTPAQKGAATRRANQEKKRLAALEIPGDSPKEDDHNDRALLKARRSQTADTSAREETHEEEALPTRGVRSRRGGTERAGNNGDKPSTRKRAASSAEPRPAAGGATKAPKKRKSDVDVSTHDQNVPMEVDEEADTDVEVVVTGPTTGRDGTRNASRHGNDDVEPLQVVRPRARFAGRGSRDANAAKIVSPPQHEQGDNDEEESEAHRLTRPRSQAARVLSSDEEDEASIKGGGDEEPEEQVASDEAEGDEAWAGGDETADAGAEDRPAPMKTSKALALQFEQATPIFKTAQRSLPRDGKEKAPRPRTRGAHEDPGDHDKAARENLERLTREDERDTLEGVQTNIRKMSIDQGEGGPGYRSGTSRRTRHHDGVGSGEREEPEVRAARRYGGSNVDDDRTSGKNADGRGDGPADRHYERSSIRQREAPSYEFDELAPPKRHGGQRGGSNDHRDRDPRERRYEREDRDDGAHRSKQGGRRDEYADSPGRAPRSRPGGRRGNSVDWDERGAPQGRRGESPRLQSSSRGGKRDGIYIEDSEDDAPRGTATRQRGRRVHSRRVGNDGYDDEEDEDDEDEEEEDVRRRRGARGRHQRGKVEQAGGGRSSNQKDRVRRRAKAAFIIDEGSSDGPGGMQERGRDAEDSEDEGRWRKRTTIKFGPDGRPTLSGQDGEVAEIIALASATEVPKFVCFEDAFPLPDDRIPYYRKALTKTAKHLKLWRIMERLQKEPGYVADMAIIPEARMSIFRGKVRDKAVAGVKLLYHFATFPAHDFVSIIAKLLEDQRYIYPGDEVKKTIQDDSPYCHDAIVTVIYESFFGGDAVKKFPLEYYPVSARSGKRQLPKSMVAFAATANDAALKAYQMGPTAVKVEFRTDVFDDVYSVHLANLDKIYSDDSDVYDGLMTYLFEQASHGIGAGPSTPSARWGGTKPITIITANVAKRFK
ncbi:hypothetical protein BV25DRAFT_1917468 [Artomyces pyxidatus]|uniref:Uncharacterized protein n=1 Tax=Artomyces pyxidatus TaxID=48021 RepID=A0ACB8SXF8_9AGAM|nr:hypothetical protein BV25DRAFT_1917468 [Artomyces pyxidatus]